MGRTLNIGSIDKKICGFRDLLLIGFQIGTNKNNDKILNPFYYQILIWPSYLLLFSRGSDLTTPNVCELVH